MKHIKVLPLDFPYKIPKNNNNFLKFIWKDMLTHLVETDVIFNRNGKYYDRKTKKAWVEREGKAYELDAQHLLYELSLAGHQPLQPKIVKSIRVLMAEGICPESLRKLLWIDRDWKEGRRVGRSARLHRIRVIGK